MQVVSLFPLFPGTNEMDQIEKIHAITGTPSPEILATMKRRSTHVEFDFPPKVSPCFHFLYLTLCNVWLWQSAVVRLIKAHRVQLQLLTCVIDVMSSQQSSEVCHWQRKVLGRTVKISFRQELYQQWQQPLGVSSRSGSSSNSFSTGSSRSLTKAAETASVSAAAAAAAVAALATLAASQQEQHYHQQQPGPGCMSCVHSQSCLE
jgi:hypothetical protein